MDIQSIVERKLSAIDIAEKEFKNAIAGLDSRLQDIIMNWLNGLQIVNGKIDPETSRVFLNKLNGLLATTINKRNLSGPVKGLLKHFDTVENYTKKTLELENTIDLSKFDLSEEKKQAINEIADALLNDDVLKSNVINPLKKIAFRHVVTGISFQDAQKEFEKALSGNPITRYSRQITSEAIHRYDGMINQRVATEYKLDAFRIVGSLISTSQAVCINMIKESGPFQGMAINGKYPMKELPAILRIVNSYKGAVPGTNESNYFINRNHWGCRHTFIPTRFTRKDLEGLPDGIVNNPENPPENNPYISRIDQAQNSKKISEVVTDIFKDMFDMSVKVTTPQKTLSYIDYADYSKHLARLSGEYKSINKGANQLSVRFASSSRKFGYVKHGFDSKDVQNLKTSELREFMNKNDRKILEVNFGNLPHGKMKNKGITRWSANVDDDNLKLYTLTHEFAHFTALSKTTAASSFFSELRQVQKDYYDKLSTIRDKTGDEYDRIYLGKYANTNIDEFLAEGFTNYKLSSSPSPFAIKIGQLFDRHFKR